MITIHRLEAHDAMQHQPEVQELEYSMEVPPTDSFSDIHSESLVPKISMAKIETYLSAQGKMFERKYKELYAER